VSTDPCLDCNTTAPGWRWRRLCQRCYGRHHYHGTHAQFERPSWANAELVAEWEWLARQGYTRAQAAERLGMSKKRLEKAIERSRRRRLQEAS
jgi:hypothetical protein